MRIAVAARGLVSRGGGDRLLVSDDGRTWYTPGGRLVPGESLRECLAREVREETGLDVRVGDLAYVAEFWDRDANEHKVECFFLATLESGGLPQGWKDSDGPVRHVRFVAEDEWNAAVYPEFLRHVGFDDPADRGVIYRGFTAAEG